MIQPKRIPITVIMIGILFMNGNGDVGSETDSPRLLFEEAQKEIYRLSFDKAYGFLSKINERYPDSSYGEKAIILKNIISLGQTFSNLRLCSAYDRGRSLYKKEEEKTADSLSPLTLLDSYRLEYLRRTKKWANRLDSDIKESLKISQEIELSLKYPGSEELPYFIKVGIDTIETIKKGIPPTPSQAQNIEESQGYAGVLSVIYLCIQEEFELPEKTILIKGKVIPKLLIYYSTLWINKVFILLRVKKYTKANGLEVLQGRPLAI